MMKIPHGVSDEDAMRIFWSSLTCDPNDRRFLEQPVSVPTPSCPAGSTVGDDVWHFPASVCAERTPHNLVVDWDIEVAGRSLVDPCHDRLRTFVKRYALARMSQPKQGILHLSTLKDAVYTIFRVVRFIVEQAGGSGWQRLSSVTVGEAEALLDHLSKNWRSSTTYTTHLGFFMELQKFGELGLTGEAFARETYEYIVGRLSKRISSGPHDRSASNYEVRHTVPVTDDYCLKIMEMSDFYCEKFAPVIVRHVKAFAEFREDERKTRSATGGLCPNSHRAALRYQVYAAEDVWPVDELPFAYDGAFPPRRWDELLPLIWTMQMLIWQLVLIFTGAHEHEMLLMTPDSLERAPDKLNSLRFKTSPQMGGEPFSWPIPRSVAAAVELQIQLCAAAGFAGVWFATQRWDKLLSGVPKQLKLFVERHGLQHLLGDDPVMSTRRYRPQLARLLLLGRHGYLRLAKRALGHADINITRSYVRMNRYIAMDLTRRDHKDAPRQPIGEFAFAKGDLDDRKLSALLAELGRKDRSLLLLAPGVFCEFSERHALDLTAFENDRTRNDAFAYALDRLASPSVRGYPRLQQWLFGEADRLATTIDADMYVAPSLRHRRIADQFFGDEATRAA